MAIVMDMCSGIIELGCPAEYDAEAARVDCKTNLIAFPEERLALQQITISTGEQNLHPVFLAKLDIDTFLHSMRND